MRVKNVNGSIYTPPDRNIIRIKFKGKVYSTGYKNTPAGRKMAEEMLKNMVWNYNNVGIEPKKKERLRINEAFEKFIESKVNNFAKTIKLYRSAYKAIITKDYYLESDSIETDIQTYIKTTTHSNVTINTYLTHLAVFVNFCSRKKWIENINISQEYKKRQEEYDTKIWKEEEIEKILNYFKTDDNEMKLMIQLMLETGARIVDCLTLERKQIRGKMIIWKNKKTKRPEPRPMSNKAVEILNQLGEREKIFRWTHAGSSFCNKKLRICLKKLNIEPEGRSFQEFRSTFRMRLVKKGIPEAYIQYLMRHQRATTTWKHYTSFETEVADMYLDKVSNN